MRACLGIMFGALVVLGAGVASGGTMAGSVHDTRGRTSSDQVCNNCHLPSNATALGPLWEHAAAGGGFTPYAMGTKDPDAGQPGGVSKLCLSCHDGILANSDSGSSSADPGNTFAGGRWPARPHPVGVSYRLALASSDGALAEPGTTMVTIGSSLTRSGTLEATLLVDGKLECTSCHDAHNRYTAVGSGMMKMSLAGSALCLKCHNK